MELVADERTNGFIWRSTAITYKLRLPCELNAKVTKRRKAKQVSANAQVKMKDGETRKIVRTGTTPQVYRSTDIMGMQIVRASVVERRGGRGATATRSTAASSRSTVMDVTAK